MKWYKLQSYYYAFAWFLKASDKKNSKAMCMLGNMYYSGEWVKSNLGTAFNWYSLAEKNNNSVALLMLGIFYMEGKSVPENKLLAKKYLSR